MLVWDSEFQKSWSIIAGDPLQWELAAQVLHTVTWSRKHKMWTRTRETSNLQRSTLSNLLLPVRTHLLKSPQSSKQQYHTLEIDNQNREISCSALKVYNLFSMSLHLHQVSPSLNTRRKLTGTSFLALSFSERQIASLHQIVERKGRFHNTWTSLDHSLSLRPIN